MTEALGPCAKACCDGCPHSHHQEAAQHRHGHHHEAPALDLQIAAA
jgi:hypothetical protein